MKFSEIWTRVRSSAVMVFAGIGISLGTLLEQAPNILEMLSLMLTPETLTWLKGYVPPAYIGATTALVSMIFALARARTLFNK